jgi:tRNA threonylcarbamoyl adenosine modification protein (Sua5/YciO/YrdC/YwlC family)
LTQLLTIHPSHPQPRLVRRAAEMVRAGALVAYPTDSCFALGCHLGDAKALARLRRVRGFDERHHLTLMCRDLSQIGAYAIVDNVQYRMLKTATPGSYTFIMRATREVPRRLLHAKRKTIGVRVSPHPFVHALLAELGEPMLSATLYLPGQDDPPSDALQVRDALASEVDLVVDAGACGGVPTTVIDLTGALPLLLRSGKGALDAIGLEPLVQQGADATL